MRKYTRWSSQTILLCLSLYCHVSDNIGKEHLLFFAIKVRDKLHDGATRNSRPTSRQSLGQTSILFEVETDASTIVWDTGRRLPSSARNFNTQHAASVVEHYTSIVSSKIDADVLFANFPPFDSGCNIIGESVPSHTRY